MKVTPELTKEEYLRLELVKAYIAAAPDLGMHSIRTYSLALAEAILDPSKADADPTSPTEKS